MAPALDAAGALRFNFVADAPDRLTGGPRPGDERVRDAHRPPARGRGRRGRRRRGHARRHRPSRRRGGRAPAGARRSDGDAPRGRRRHRQGRGAPRRPRRRRHRPPLAAAALARRRRRPCAGRGARGLRLRLLRPPLPVGRRLDAARRSGPSSSTTARSPPSPCPPTTARGGWASSPAPATPPMRALQGTSTRWETVVKSLPARRPLDRRRAHRRWRRRHGQDRGPPPPLRASTASRWPPASSPSATRGRAPTRRWAGAPRSPSSTPSPCATCCAQQGLDDPMALARRWDRGDAARRSSPGTASTLALRPPPPGRDRGRRSPASPTSPTTRSGS